MIVVTGASGFIGRALCDAVRATGEAITTIGRGAGSDVQWPADGEFTAPALARMAGARAVVHLAGEPIGVRWTAQRKRAIVESRTVNTARLARAIAALDPKPSVLLSSSGVGYYGSRGDEWLDESASPGADFLAGVAQAWEAATGPAREAGIRVVLMRCGLVFGRDGGMLAEVAPPFRLGLGGPLGTGEQWMSWIALDDLVRMFLAAADDASLSGPVNAVSPNPVRNSEFTAALGAVLHRPALIPVPAFALRALFGEMADGALLASQRARPARMLAAGFAFNHPAVGGALRAALTP